MADKNKAKFFDPKNVDLKNNDLRLHAPHVDRNKDVILNVLKDYFPEKATVLEFASGTGQHASYFASQLPNIHWIPSDIEDDKLASILAWKNHCGMPNLADPLYLNLMKEWPLLPKVDAVCAFNLIHIAPWTLTRHLFKAASSLLESGGQLYLYGPYKRGGEHTSQSNVQFDRNLKSSNPEWGVRAMEDVIEAANRTRFADPTILPMPANNFSLIFEKL
ncbi:DUF938 domain-containing protein [Temperatibacter marinus]|uniref:DUF938 domain-containing protein n=1 Tax=Temperatibacter marinus TaxID=1456591 RepID=A0AA52EG48_9PROT|nr:DUF938 domain-containing protein [Temperatibacter marinus]WND04110.1 DUF938 domain-containing protein [Temperatibacter marinus]